MKFETHHLQVVCGTDIVEDELFMDAKPSENEKTSFKTLNQVKNSHENTVYVFFFAALPVDNANINPADFFGPLFNFSSSCWSLFCLENFIPQKIKTRC